MSEAGGFETSEGSTNHHLEGPFAGTEISAKQRAVATAIHAKLFPDDLEEEIRIPQVTMTLNGEQHRKTKFAAFQDASGGRYLATAVAKEMSTRDDSNSEDKWSAWAVRYLDPSGREVEDFSVSRRAMDWPIPEERGTLVARTHLLTYPEGSEDAVRAEWETNGGFILSPSPNDQTETELSEERLERIAEGLRISTFDPALTDAAAQGQQALKRELERRTFTSGSPYGLEKYRDKTGDSTSPIVKFPKNVDINALLKNAGDYLDLAAQISAGLVAGVDGNEISDYFPEGWENETSNKQSESGLDEERTPNE